MVKYPTVQDFLVQELGLSEHSLLHFLKSDDMERHLEFCQASKDNILSRPLLLAESILGTHENILLKEGVRLDKYLKTLLNHAANEENILKQPVAVVVDDELANFYQQKLTVKISALLDLLSNEDNQDSSNFLNLPTVQKELHETKNQFMGLFNLMISQPSGIETFLSVLKGGINKTNPIIPYISQAFVTMGVMKSITANMEREDANVMIINMGLCTLLQDISMIIDPEKYSETDKVHAEASAELAKTLNVDPDVVTTISLHHTTEENGIPLFAVNETQHSLYTKILITFNMFISILEVQKLKSDSYESFKHLNHLVLAGHADLEVTNILSEFFLPMDKHQLIKAALKISQKCKLQPIAWSLKGDLLPVKYLCPIQDCQHHGSDKSYIPEAIEVVYNDNTLVKIPKGTYYSCQRLSPELMALHSEIKKGKK